MNPFMMPPGTYPGYRGGYGNTMMNGFYNQMFIRKAQEETYDDYEYRGGGRNDRRKDRYNKRGGGNHKYDKPRGDKEKKFISVEEIEKRTAVNPENFPPLIADDRPYQSIIQPDPKEEKKVKEKEEKEKKSNKRIRLDKQQIIDTFQNLGTEVKANPFLSTISSEIPVVALQAKAQLEFLTPTPIRKNSSTPKLTPKLSPH